MYNSRNLWDDAAECGPIPSNPSEVRDLYHREMKYKHLKRLHSTLRLSLLHQIGQLANELENKPIASKNSHLVNLDRSPVSSSYELTSDNGSYHNECCTLHSEKVDNLAIKLDSIVKEQANIRAQLDNILALLSKKRDLSLSVDEDVSVCLDGSNSFLLHNIGPNLNWSLSDIPEISLTSSNNIGMTDVLDETENVHTIVVRNSPVSAGSSTDTSTTNIYSLLMREMSVDDIRDEMSVEGLAQSVLEVTDDEEFDSNMFCQEALCIGRHQTATRENKPQQRYGRNSNSLTGKSSRHCYCCNYNSDS